MSHTSDTQRSSVDKTLFGIAMMVSAFFLFTLVDTCAKWLSSGYPIGQILFARGAIAIIPLMIFLKLRNPWSSFRTNVPYFTLLRGVSYFITGFLFFYSLKFLELAEATVLMFVSPFLITALSVVILKEQVGWQRWLAIVVGFSGVYVAMNPDFDNFSYASLLPVAAAFFFALACVLTRLISKHDSNTAMMFYGQVIALVLAAGAALFGWEAMSLKDYGIIFVMSTAQVLAVYCMIQAYRHAEAAVIAPFEYSALVWATAMGWIVFQEWPENRVWLGAAILIACGLFIIYRERKSAKRIAAGDGVTSPDLQGSISPVSSGPTGEANPGQVHSPAPGVDRLDSKASGNS